LKYNKSYYGKLGYTSYKYEQIIEKWLQLNKKTISELSDELSDIQINYETYNRNINLSTLCNLLYELLCNGHDKYYVLPNNIFRFIKIKCIIPNEIRMFKIFF